MLEAGQVVMLVLLGAWVALDGTSLAQLMVSRPLVSGSLSGWILGDPALGFVVGAVLEAAHLGGVPVGGTRIAEPGPAAIPGVAAALGVGGPAGLAIGTLLGMAWSLLGGASMVWQRRLNGVVLSGLDEVGASAGALSRRHLGCVALDGLRGMVVVGAGLVLAMVLPAAIAGAWALNGSWTLGILALPGAFAGGGLLRRWSATWAGTGKGAALFAGSLVAGWIFAVAVR